MTWLKNEYWYDDHQPEQNSIGQDISNVQILAVFLHVKVAHKGKFEQEPFLNYLMLERVCILMTCGLWSTENNDSQIVIVSCEEERRSIIEEIGEEVLPVEYGGRAKLIALQDVVLPHLDA